MRSSVFLILLMITAITVNSQRASKPETIPSRSISDTSYKNTSLREIYNKIFYTQSFNDFTSLYSPVIKIGLNGQPTEISIPTAAPKKEVYVLTFSSHPYFKDSVKGRFEMHVTYTGESSIPLVLSKLFFDFDTESEAREFLSAFIKVLLPVSNEHWFTKTETHENYAFASDLQFDRYEKDVKRYAQGIILDLSQNKSGGFQLSFGDLYSE